VTTIKKRAPVSDSAAVYFGGSDTWIQSGKNVEALRQLHCRESNRVPRLCRLQSACGLRLETAFDVRGDVVCAGEGALDEVVQAH
jgi:hypothetical protein